MATAIKKGDVQTIQQLAKKVKLNEVHYEDMTFLLYAMHTNKKESITTLIQLGANPMQYDSELGSPLILAARSDSSDLLKVMLDAGADPNAVDDGGTPIICYAAPIDSMETLKLLVDRGANLDKGHPRLKYTALYEARCSQAYKNVIFLIKSGARVDIATKVGVTMGYCVEADLENFQPKDKEYKQLLIIKQLLIERGIKFPAEVPAHLRK